MIYPSNNCRAAEELSLNEVDALTVYRELPGFGRGNVWGQLRVGVGPELRRTGRVGQSRELGDASRDPNQKVGPCSALMYSAIIRSCTLAHLFN